MPTASPEEYGVGVVCALPKEMLAAQAMFDDGHEPLRINEAGDLNNYVVGHVHGHKVVIACLPAGVYGTVAAATVATNMLRTFRGIRIGLMIGIGGGIPEPIGDGTIRLGDVVVSQPSGNHGGVIQHDQGKNVGEGKFILQGYLNRPPTVLLSALPHLQANNATTRRRLKENISSMIQKAAEEDDGYEFPGLDRDILFCARCDRSEWTPWHWLVWILLFWLYPLWICQQCYGQKIPRSVNHTTAEVHYGIIASGNVLLKNRIERDRLRTEFGAKCIEMEAAGLMNDFPCLVIRGVCDYADSHKNDDWQKYAAITAAAFAKILLSVLSPAEVYTVPRAAEFMEPVHSIPMKRMVKTFFGREEELNKITTYFNQAKGSGTSRMLVLRAMGGQGKTQIALKYCHSARESYKGIFWIDSSSTLAMTQSMVGVARELDSSQSASLPDDEARVRFVVHTLEKWNYRWLLVFDNCDDASTFPELQNFIPYAGQGSVLFTSRHRGLEELADVVEVAPMPHEAGVQLLLHRYRDINIDNCFAEATKIVDRLGNLALAIEQASAYMNYIHLPIDQLNTFLPRYFAQREKVLQHTTSDFWRYSRIVDSAERETAISAFTTWELSFQRLLDSEPHRDHIAHFLILTAFFGRPPVHECIFRFHWELSKPRPIWMSTFAIEKEEIKEEGPGQSEEDSTTQAELEVGSHQAFGQTQLNDTTTSWGSARFWRLVREAFQLSLLHDISPADKVFGASLTLHPLIRDWLQLRVALGERQAYTREAISILNSSIQHTTNSTAQIKIAILLHLNDVLVNDNEFFSDEHRLGQEISTCDDADVIASFYRDQGQYTASLNLYNREVATKKAVMGGEHPSTLDSISGLALALRYQGKYAEAELIHRQVLEVRERVLGDTHPDTLTSINNVAKGLSDQGDYDEAEKMHYQALAVAQRTLGIEHPKTLTSMFNLADVLYRQSNHQAAEQMLRELLEMRKRVLGAESRHTLITMSTLAKVLGDQGEHDDAVQIHCQVLEVRKRVLGDEHPDTLMGMNGLALALRYQAKYVEADKLYSEVLEVRRRVLGDEHPDTLTSMSNVAIVLYYQGKYDMAEKINRQALEVRKRVLTENHPDTLVNMNDLALVLRELGEYDEAEQIHRQELQARRQSRGDEHSITLTSMNNLALVLRRQGKNSEAEQLHRQVAGARERTLGAEHPSTLVSMSNLAITLRHQGKFSEAEPICRRVLQARQRVLGDEHPDTLISVNNLALVLSNQGKHTEAEQMHRQELEVTRRVQGDKHPHTLASMNNLGKVLCIQGKYREAEDIQLQAVLASFTILGRRHPTSEEYLDCLRHTWERQGGEENRVRCETFLEKLASLG